MKVEILIPPNTFLINSLLRDKHDLFLNENILFSLLNYYFDLERMEQSHKLPLIKPIIQSYGSIRINSLARRKHETISGGTITQ